MCYPSLQEQYDAVYPTLGKNLLLSFVQMGTATPFELSQITTSEILPYQDFVTILQTKKINTELFLFFCAFWQTFVIFINFKKDLPLKLLVDDACRTLKHESITLHLKQHKFYLPMDLKLEQFRIELLQFIDSLLPLDVNYPQYLLDLVKKIEQESELEMQDVASNKRIALKNVIEKRKIVTGASKTRKPQFDLKFEKLVTRTYREHRDLRFFSTYQKPSFNIVLNNFYKLYTMVNEIYYPLLMQMEEANSQSHIKADWCAEL